MRMMGGEGGGVMMVMRRKGEVIMRMISCIEMKEGVYSGICSRGSLAPVGVCKTPEFNRYHWLAPISSPPLNMPLNNAHANL